MAVETAAPALLADERRGRDVPVPETRWICAFVSLVLLAAVAVLWVPPGRTADLFAWPIKPELTPLYMGSAYGAGAFFFFRGFRERRWHRVAAGFPGIGVFAALMLAATAIHWDKFNHGEGPFVAAASFYAWTIVYAVSPLLVAWAWLRNRRADDGAPEARDAAVPRAIRAAAAVAGAAMVAYGAVVWASPQVGIDTWPWTLTPLTARVIASFTIESGLIALFLAREARWSGWRILVQTSVVGGVLLLVGLARASGNLDGGALAAVFVACIAATVAAAAALHVAMERRAR